MHKDVTILRTMAFPEAAHRRLEEVFTVVDLPRDADSARRLLRERGAEIRGVAARRASLTAEDLALMPNLEIIANFGAGMDGIDVAAARARNVVVRNGSSAVADDVADLAIGITVALLRGVVRADEFVRSGAWAGGEFPLGRSLWGLRAGIVGLGHIGLAVAKRLEVMRCEIAYFGPRRKPVAYPYFDDIVALAAWADLLVVTCPATAETRRLVNARVLEALGSRGYLVNVARGVIVDEPALVDALERGVIAGAALDVFEQEPSVPPELAANRRLVLTPHIGGAAAETHERMGANVLRILLEHFGAPAPRG
jgi:lactate dehydrogenase-like 2-hydroxyacid dehydrogenase